MLFAWWLTCGTPRTLEPHGVFDFGRCFQVRIDVTVEAKQLQAHGGGSIGMLGGGLLQKLRKNYGTKPFRIQWLISISPNSAFNLLKTLDLFGEIALKNDRKSLRIEWPIFQFGEIWDMGSPQSPLLVN